MSNDLFDQAFESLRQQRGRTLVPHPDDRREEIYGTARAQETPDPVAQGVARDLQVPLEAVKADPERFKAVQKQQQLQLRGQEAALHRPGGELIANHPLDANEMRKSLTWMESIFGKGRGFVEVTGDYIDRGQHISELTMGWRVAYDVGDERDRVEFNSLRLSYPQVPEGGSWLGHALGPAFEQLFGPRLTVLLGAAPGAAVGAVSGLWGGPGGVAAGAASGAYGGAIVVSIMLETGNALAEYANERERLMGEFPADIAGQNVPSWDEIRYASIAVGLANGAVEAFFGKYLLKILGGKGILAKIAGKDAKALMVDKKIFPYLVMFGKRLAESALVNGFEEAVQEGFLILGGKAVGVNSDTALDSAYRVGGSFAVGTQAGAGTTVLASPISAALDHQVFNRRVMANRQLLDDLKEASDLEPARAMRENDPESFLQWVQEMVEASGRDKNLYLRPKDLMEFLQEEGVDAQQIQQDMPEIFEQLEVAGESGHDVVIPIADYATYLAPNYHDALRDRVRHGVSAKSPAEVEAGQGALDAEMQELLDAQVEAEQSGVFDEEATQSRESRLREILITRFYGAEGVSAPEAAVYADVLMALSVRREARGSAGALDWVESSFGVQGPEPATKTSLETLLGEAQVDEMLTDLRLDRQPELDMLTEHPVLEMLDTLGGVAPGSDLATALAGIDLPAKWQRKLFREGGRRGLDEEGLMGEELLAGLPITDDGRPDPDAVFEAIRGELAGSPLRTDQEAETLRTTGQAREQLRSVLDELGLDLETLDNPQVMAALERVWGDAQIAEDRDKPFELAQATRDLARRIPGLKGILANLQPEEASKLNKATAAKLVKIFQGMPAAGEVASLAWAGRAKRGWYKRSAKAIVDIFGTQDAPRFVALLAALSPQLGVKENATNALKTWVAWKKDGAKHTEAAVVRALRVSVPMSKIETKPTKAVNKMIKRANKEFGAKIATGGTLAAKRLRLLALPIKMRQDLSILEAWKQNAVRALTTSDPIGLVLSGPKVHSFAMNLRGYVNEVTLDTHMAHAYGVEQTVFGGGLNKAGTDPGKVPAYLAGSALTRAAANILTERTGESWTAFEVQETVWSWVRSLTEQTVSKEEGRTILQIVRDQGGPDMDRLIDTEDFAMLFTEGALRNILEGGKYGRGVRRARRSGQRAARADGEGSVDTGDPSPGIAERSHQAHLNRAAKRLDALIKRKGGKVFDLMQEEDLRSWRTDDGFTFYEQEDGSVTDGEEQANAEADMFWPSIADFLAEMDRGGVEVTEITDRSPQTPAAQPDGTLPHEVLLNGALYSQLGRVLRTEKQRKWESPAALRKHLIKNRKVKEREILWSGLDTWLEGQAGKVDLDVAMEAIRLVQLEETLYGRDDEMRSRPLQAALGPAVALLPEPGVVQLADIDPAGQLANDWFTMRLNQYEIEEEFANAFAIYATHPDAMGGGAEANWTRVRVWQVSTWETEDAALEFLQERVDVQLQDRSAQDIVGDLVRAGVLTQDAATALLPPVQVGDIPGTQTLEEIGRTEERIIDDWLEYMETEKTDIIEDVGPDRAPDEESYRAFLLRDNGVDVDYENPLTEAGNYDEIVEERALKLRQFAATEDIYALYNYLQEQGHPGYEAGAARAEAVTTETLRGLLVAQELEDGGGYEVSEVTEVWDQEWREAEGVQPGQWAIINELGDMTGSAHATQAEAETEAARLAEEWVASLDRDEILALMDTTEEYLLGDIAQVAPMAVAGVPAVPMPAVEDAAGPVAQGLTAAAPPLSSGGLSYSNREWRLEGDHTSPREWVLRVPSESSALISKRYTGGHFGAQDMIAWMRTTDRIGPNGEKVFAIEEEQSDRAAEGHERGFATPIPQVRKDWTATSEGGKTIGVAQLSREQAWVVRDADGYEVARISDHRARTAVEAINVAFTGNLHGVDITRYYADEKSLGVWNVIEIESGNVVQELQGVHNEARALVDYEAIMLKVQESGVPDMPWRRDWTGLLMKRAVAYASTHGYDGVAWTTGAQQIDRWQKEMQKRVHSFEWDRAEGDDRILFKIRALEQSDADPAWLTLVINPDKTVESAYINGDPGNSARGDLVGKKLTQVVPRRYAEDALALGPGQGGSVVDKNLTIGGKKFLDIYDEQMSQEAKKLGKQHGSVPRDINLPGVTHNLHYLELTDGLREDASGGFALFARKGGRTQGALRFDPTEPLREVMLRLTEAKDKTTIGHELAHLALLTMIHDAQLPGAEPQLQADLQTVLAFLGASRVEDIIDVETGDVNVELNESFARTTEAWLLEGKAPSTELAAAFARMKPWFRTAYGTGERLQALGGKPLNQEFRDVLARLLASEEAIEEHRADPRFQPGWKEKPDYMTSEAWERYERAYDQRFELAEEQAYRRMMNSLRSELSEQWKQRELTVHREVELEVQQSPAFRLRHWLQTGAILGDDITPPDEDWKRLDRDALSQLFPGILGKNQETGRNLIPQGGVNGVVQKDGMHPQEAADRFGFTSMQALVDGLVRSNEHGSIKQYINQETKRRMRDRFGDPLHDGTINELALEALEGDEHARFLERELRILRRQLGVKGTPQHVARRLAAKEIGRREIQEINPTLFRRAEQRAAREFLDAMAAQDLEAAHGARMRQLMNHYLVEEATKQKDRSERLRAYERKFDKKSVRQKIGRAGQMVEAKTGEAVPEGTTFLDQIDAVRDRADFRRMPDAAARRRVSLKEFVDTYKAPADPAVPAMVFNFADHVLDELEKKPWRTMTLDELEDYIDALKQLEHQALARGKLMKARDEKDFEVVQGRLLEELGQNQRYTRAAAPREPRLPTELLKRRWDGWFADMRKPASLANEFSGGPGGAWFDFFVRGMDESGDWEANQRMIAAEAMLRIFEPYRKLEGRIGSIGMWNTVMTTPMQVPGTNIELSYMGRLMVLLNLGNEINQSRIMVGEKWSEQDIEAILATFNKGDFDFAQQVWDYIHSFWPQIEALDQRINGVASPGVDAVALDTPFGRYPGGYFPIASENMRQGPGQVQGDPVAEVNQQLKAGRHAASYARSNHRKARSESLKLEKPIRLDFEVIIEHLEGVIHDLAWTEWLLDANKILRDKAIAGEIIRGYGRPVLSTLEASITSIAIGNIPPQNTGEWVLNHARNGATVAALGLSATTAIVQWTGIGPTIARVGPKWVMVGARKWMHGSPQDHRITRDWVTEKSTAMKIRWNHRHTNLSRELGDLHSRLLTRGLFNGKVRDSFMWHIVEMQSFVDVVTWIAGYEKALSEGNTDERAVALADRLVKDTQGHGGIQDLAQAQLGSAGWRMVTNFYSYFSTMQNLTAEEVHRLLPAEGPKHRARYAGFLLTAIFGPTIINRMLLDALKQDYDDDEEWLEYMARISIQENIIALASQQPLVRDVVPPLVERIFTGHSFGTQPPTGWRLFDEMGRFGQQAVQGDFDHAAVRSLVSVVGVATKTPATFWNRLISTHEFVQEGGKLSEAPLAPFVSPPQRRNR